VRADRHASETVSALITGIRLIRGLEHFKGNPIGAKALSSIRKIIFFDMALAIDTYIAAYLETMTRHQAAIRELSTPVIKVHDRILLLPIVGTVDTQRANQIMETVLVQVVEQQARVIISTLPESRLSTPVADHILQTTAVQLLGSQTTYRNLFTWPVP
jgi:rsbT co-antagonist protein RsbR